MAIVSHTVGVLEYEIWLFVYVSDLSISGLVFMGNLTWETRLFTMFVLGLTTTKKGSGMLTNSRLLFKGFLNKVYGMDIHS